jgi:hypothetical protein
MISTRNIIVSLLSLAVAVFALPAVAANAKSYRLDNFPSTIGYNETIVQEVIVFNTSPAGNSNFNSFRLVAPTGIQILAASAGTASPYGSNISADPVSNGGRWVEVTNISPSVGRGVGFPLKLTLKGAQSCGGGVWATAMTSGKATEVWSGQLSGQLFANETTPPTSTYVGSSTGSSLDISISPSGSSSNTVVSGTAYTVNVAVLNGCGTTPPATIVTLTAENVLGTTVTISGSPASSGTTGIASFGATFTKPGSATLVATAGSVTKSLALTVFEFGSLDCNQNLPTSSISNTGSIPIASYDATTGLGTSGVYAGVPVPGWVGNAFRAPNNKNGEPCVKVDWRFDNNIVSTTENPALPDNSINLAWDLQAQKSAVYQYSANFQPEPAVGGVLDPATKWQFEWYLPDGVTKSGLVDAQACLGPALPASYGTLTAKVEAGATTISINPGVGTLPAVPFPIVIDNERMVVTSTSTANIWVVARGEAVGGPATLPVHEPYYAAPNASTPKAVMSTSFPLYTPTGSTNPKPMQMCLVEQGWAVVPWQACSDAGYTAPASPALPPACLVPYATIRDGGDGFTIRD